MKIGTTLPRRAAAIILAATIVVATAVPAHAAADAVPAQAAYRIVNLWSGKCLQPNGPGPNALIVQNKCASLTTQRWYQNSRGGGYVEFRNAGTGFCMDLLANSEAEVVPGTLVQQFWCHPEYTSEDWLLGYSDHPNFRLLVTRINWLCGDIVNRSGADYAQLQLYYCKPYESAQQFQLQLVA